MSIKITDEIIALKLPLVEAVILSEIVQMTKHYTDCRCSHSYFANELGITERAVRRAITNLRKAGFVTGTQRIYTGSEAQQTRDESAKNARESAKMECCESAKCEAESAKSVFESAKNDSRVIIENLKENLKAESESKPLAPPSSSRKVHRRPKAENGSEVEFVAPIQTPPSDATCVVIDISNPTVPEFPSVLESNRDPRGAGHPLALTAPKKPPFKGSDGPCWFGSKGAMPGFVYAYILRFEKAWGDLHGSKETVSAVREALKYYPPAEWRMICAAIGLFLLSEKQAHDGKDADERKFIPALAGMISGTGWHKVYFSPADEWVPAMSERHHAEAIATDAEEMAKVAKARAKPTPRSTPPDCTTIFNESEM